jgi:Kef-type K+ transport system membrane component KefB
MSDVVVLITSLALIIIFSPFLAKVLRLPTTPIEIILGALFGYFGWIYHNELFETVAEIGFIYLMFIAGTEVNIKKVIKTPLSIMKKIALYLGLLYLISFSFTIYFELGKIFAVLLPLISVGLVASLMKEYGKTSWLELSMTAGSIGEVVSISVLTLASAGLEYGLSLHFFQTIVALVLFTLFIFLLFRALQLLFWWFPEVSTVLMPHEDNKEQDIRLSLAILFLLIGVMLALNLELAFGAFIAGIFIPTFFEHKQELPEKLAGYGFGFLIPLFFINIGSAFHFEAFAIQGLLALALEITLIMITMRVVSSLVFKNEVGLRNSVLMGLSHAMPLTLLIAIATLAFHANSIDELHYYAFILAALFEVLIVMILIKFIHTENENVL